MNRKNFYWAAYIPRAIIINLSTFGPVGTLLKAPGTWGSVLGLFLYVFFFKELPNWAYISTLLVGTYLTMGICNEAEIRFNTKDPGFVILDEIIAIPFCFIFLFPEGSESSYTLWVWLLLGFILFRILDITKPWIIGRLQEIGGGFGVVIDDVVAAIFTNLILQILFWMTHG